MRVAFQKKHPLDKCESIMKKSLNERIKKLRKIKLSYGCLKPTDKNHKAVKLPTMTNSQNVHCLSACLNWKTFTGEKSKETLLVDNLKIAGVNKMNNDWISFPKAYSNKIFPVENE